MTKTQANKGLAVILAPINDRRATPSAACNFGSFVEGTYLPFYRRKWKASTVSTNEYRVRFHLTAEFSSRTLGSFNRDELQDVLDRKVTSGLSFSTVAHLRWDLNQVFKMAVAEGFLSKNPAELLFTPREALRPLNRSMTIEEVRVFFSVLGLRERVVGGLAILAGLRPGEIFGLVRKRLDGDCADIQQRIYRGVVDSPKSINSRRVAALSSGLLSWIQNWCEMLPDAGPDAWVFPSETLSTPVSKDNCWRRHFLPKLKEAGLEWVNFQAMRRTHSSLLDDLGVDPQIRADQMGHTVDVNQNVYTKASIDRRRDAVKLLEEAVGIM